jgi:DNA repair exonuclease SbcCD ATPase subunit
VYKKLNSQGIFFESKKYYENQIGSFITENLHQSGYAIDPKAAAMLVSFLGTDLSRIVNELNKLKIKLETAKEQVKQNRIAAVDAEDHLSKTEQARDLIQQVGQAVQQEAHDRLAGVVSRCLETVFDEPYEFKIVFDKKRNQTEARLVFVRDGFEVSPLDAAGGGVVDVAAFALRLSCLLLRRPASRRLLVLDEPFRFLSEQYRPRVKQMLEELSERMKIQIVQVTHAPELVAGKVIEMG